jgi:integrase
LAGSLQPRGKGTWSLIYDLPKGADGKRRQKWTTFKGNKTDAGKELARLVTLHGSSHVEDHNQTFDAFLTRWLHGVELRLSPKTFERYQDIVESVFRPNFGNLKVGNVRPMDIQRLYRYLQESGRVKVRKGQTKGLSAQTVLHYHRLLHKILEDALRWRVIEYNPADAADPPKVTKKQRTALEAEEIVRLLAVAKGTSYYTPILLAVSCGMRRGEILGLKWEDVDLETGAIVVKSSLSETRKGLALKDTKTGRTRIVQAPPFAVKELSRILDETKELVKEELYQNHGLVCHRGDGRPISPDSFSGQWRSVRDTAKLPPISFHDLRHTHATLLLVSGMHPKIVSDRLGHSTIGITLDLYSHVTPAMQDQAANRIEELLG